MTYTGIFVRDFVGETPDGSHDGKSFTDSPDIISDGPNLIKDISTLTNQANYDAGTPVYQNQTPLQNNYVYVRGINETDGAQDSTIYLYYVDTTIVLWPQNWKTLGITYQTQPTNAAPVSAAAKNGIVVTNPPFQWVPPRKGVHYCLTAWVKNGSDQGTPPDLYSIGAVNDMASFIFEHPNVGWRNTIEVDATQPTIQNSSLVEGPADGGILNIGVQCENLPTDGYIAFSVAGSDKSNTIVFPKTPIANPNYAPTVQVSWPKGFKSTLEFTYWKGSTALPDHANIVPIVGTYGANEKFIKEVERVRPSLLTTVQHYDSPEEVFSRSQAVPPRKLFLVGSVPFKLRT